MNKHIITALAVFGAALSAAALLFCITKLTTVDISEREMTGEEVEPVIITTTAIPLASQTFSVPITDIPETTVEIPVVPEEIRIPYDFPSDMPTHIKSCTDYRWYNVKGTPQKALQAVCYTDENGIRRYKDDYCVGMGSYYFHEIGDRYEVTLDTGAVITVIMADMKADCDTDALNQYSPCIDYEGRAAANILEFIIDKEILPREVYRYGSLDYFDFLKGNIVEIVYLGKADYENGS